jgi:hypothetical protein
MPLQKILIQPTAIIMEDQLFSFGEDDCGVMTVSDGCSDARPSAWFVRQVREPERHILEELSNLLTPLARKPINENVLEVLVLLLDQRFLNPIKPGLDPSRATDY